MRSDDGVSSSDLPLPKDCGLLGVYRALLASDTLRPDPAQEEIIIALHSLCEKLHAYKTQAEQEQGAGWIQRLRLRLNAEPTAPAPCGIYIWGDVGRGKSFLMDLFFQNLPLRAKRRLHFHEFMREVHERLHTLRRQPKTYARDDMGDPLETIAENIAMDASILCLDELEIHDIGDAMIVGKLFQALIGHGVVVVTTSNRPPKDLYKDGLQREKFLPFIDLIYGRMDIAHLSAERDYRLGRLQGAKLYLTPNGPDADEELERLFADIAGSVAPHADSILVKGRAVPVPKAAGSVAFFQFSDLCAQALGGADYLEIAARYQAVILANIPKMTSDLSAEARRFVTLVDIFYDHRVKLIVSAEVLPEFLYDGDRGGFEFHRTVSRLTEMQAEDYLGIPHLP